jgi:hypothetical protein
VAHHQEADRRHSMLTSPRQVLLSDVCLCAMSSDASDTCPELARALQTFNRPYPRQKQHSDTCLRDSAGSGPDQIVVVRSGFSVLNR